MAEDIVPYRRVTAACLRVSIGTVAARSTRLEAGLYVVTSDVDCYIRQGDASVSVTSLTGVPLWRKERLTFGVRGEILQYPDAYLSVLLYQGAKTGTLWIEKLVA